MQERAFANDKVDFIWDSVVKEIKGNDLKVTNVDIENVKTGQVNNYAFGGVFIYVGLDPVSSMVKELDITDEAGWIPTDDHMKTKVAGVLLSVMSTKRSSSNYDSCWRWCRSSSRSLSIYCQ